MIKVDLRSVRFVDREAFLVDFCRGRHVLHLGATDAPCTREMIEASRFLHARLQPVVASMVGMDIDREMIALLRNEYGIDNIRYGNIEALEDYPSQRFDVVIAGEILEHLSNPGRALDALRAKMDNETRLVVTVPNAYAIKGFLRAVVGHEFIHPDHVLHHSRHTLQALMGRHGFRVEETFTFVNGGTGFIAGATNLFIRVFPQLAEGIGVVCRKSSDTGVRAEQAS